MKKILYILSITVLVLVAGFTSADELNTTPDVTHELVILHTNDHHGHPMKFAEYPVSDIGGLSARATAVNEVRATNENVLVLDAGDINTGMPESNFFKAEPDIIGYNYIGYNAMAVGNHEFDVDMETMQKQIELSEFPWLMANVTYTDGTRIPNIEPYTIVDFGTFKVGILGMLTVETEKTGNPAYVGDLVFHDEVETARELVPQIRKEADIVIALVHMGIYEDPTIGALSLAAEVPGLAAVVSGHTHTPPDEYVVVTNIETGAQVPVVQAGKWGKYLGNLELEFVNGQVTNFSVDPISINLKERVTLDDGSREVRPLGPQFEEDALLLAQLQPFTDRVADFMGRKVGTASGVFDQDIVRLQESAIGDAVSESMYWYTEKFQLRPDFAFQNGGGVRANLPEGEFTIGNVYEILPFDNTVFTVAMKGSDVIELFDMTPAAVSHGAMPQVSSQVSFTIDTASGTVGDLMIGGSPVDPNREYIVVTNSYLAAGGDGYSIFANSYSPYDTSAMQRDAFIDYVQEGLDGTLELSTDGRMTVN